MLKKTLTILLLVVAFTGVALTSVAQKTVPVAEGWANNSVNTVVFRKNALVTFKKHQFIAFYNAEGRVVVGKRKLGSTQWQLHTTAFKGNVADAHNSISIMVDGEGFLHLSWDHHNNPLRYAISKQALGLEMSEKIPMTGEVEQRVTYPEFYRLPNGDLLFMYRNGASGKGNLVLKRYSVQHKKWQTVQENLIDGQNQRNAYWQACLDTQGTLHLSWVWRESADVSSNHDMAYARSKDGGITWENSQGVAYQLPITAQTAEYACKIPQRSELINQTSMVADVQGNPYIATYFKEKNDSIPQYHLIFLQEKQWQVRNLGFRKTPFSLSGVGTKRIPIARPQLITWQYKNQQAALLLFRDAERGDKVSTAYCANLKLNQWVLKDVSESVGSWEPSYDTELWKSRKQLHVFVQKVEQADGEGKANIPPQTVAVVEIPIK